MPQPQVPPRGAGPRGNSAVTQFKPKRWQVEDRCGICSIEFSLMTTRHHCRSCGLSVCSKHSKNRVIVPTSLSKVPQRVCDKCYPRCRSIAMGLAPSAPPVRRDLPTDKLLRLHTLEPREERDPGRRIRSPPEGPRNDVEGTRRDNRTWNGDDGYDESMRMMRRDGELRTMQTVRGRRLRSPQAQSPHGRDPREVVSSRGRPRRDEAMHFRDLSHDSKDQRKKRDPRDKEQRNRDVRESDPRKRDPREREIRERDPRERDLRERDPRKRDLRERDPREKALREKDLREISDPRKRDVQEKRDPRERNPRERNPREINSRERDPRERDRRIRDPRERDLRGKDPHERERRLRDPREKDLRERERRDRDPRAKDPRERERHHDRALHERDLFDSAPRARSSRDSPEKKERLRCVLNSEPIRNPIHEKMLGPAPVLVKRDNGKLRTETSSTCRTTSSTLSSLYAAVNATEDIKTQALPPKSKPKRSPPRKEKENQSAFADSTFSIFSLAGSDHSDSESKPRKNAAQNTSARKPRKGPSNGVNRESLEKKEHLDFSASSSCVKNLEVSAITQKYLKPKPAIAATSLNPMIEESSESEEPNAEPSRRKADPRRHPSDRRRNALPLKQGKHGNKARGEARSIGHMLPSFRRDRTIDKSFRDTSEILREQGTTLAQNMDSEPKRTLSISEYNGFEATQLSLSSDKCFGDDDEQDEAFAELLAASNRGKQDLTAKLRAKKAAIAGIDSASLDAKEKARTTANYELTKRDHETMQQISELEAVVLQHQNDLPDLLDMYSEATKRAQKAQKELQKAKVRVTRYERAHAAVARAIRSGNLYMKQKEYMAAILELSRAAGIERSNATLWYMLAECRLMVSQPAAAENACMTSLKLCPTGAGMVLLGRIMHERGRSDEAIEFFSEALGRNDASEDEEDNENQ